MQTSVQTSPDPPIRSPIARLADPEGVRTSVLSAAPVSTNENKRTYKKCLRTALHPICLRTAKRAAHKNQKSKAGSSPAFEKLQSLITTHAKPPTAPGVAQGRIYQPDRQEKNVRH